MMNLPGRKRGLRTSVYIKKLERQEVKLRRRIERLIMTAQDLSDILKGLRAEEVRRKAGMSPAERAAEEQKEVTEQLATLPVTPEALSAEAEKLS